MNHYQNPLGYIALVPKEGSSDDAEIHVIPERDLIKHDIQNCWCRPMPNPEADELVWMHNAKDGRDDYLHNNRKPH